MRDGVGHQLPTVEVALNLSVRRLTHGGDILHQQSRRYPTGSTAISDPLQALCDLGARYRSLLLANELNELNELRVLRYGWLRMFCR
jgi:hypothetical protein